MNAPFPTQPERTLALAPEYADTAPDAGAGERARIREGIRKGEFSLAYQPIVDVRSGMAVGAEALLRWRHPERGWLQPGSFEQILHDPGVSWDITAFVLDRIFTDLAALPDEERRGFVSFNVYPSQLRGGRLKELVETRYLARGGAPESLVIELLESEPHVTCDELIVNVQALRALGLRVAIDDLGCGAWTLADLMHLKVDVVKLARELICQIPSSDAAMTIVAGTLRILDALGTQVIAEGVETDEQIAWVATDPKLWAQGYAFSRAQPDLASAIGWTHPAACAHV